MTTFTDWHDVPADFPPCVYYLADPRTPNAPRYVGTSKSLKNRVREHMRPESTKHPALKAWVDAMQVDGVSPVLRVMSTHATQVEAMQAEWRLATRWMRRGIPIFGRHIPPKIDQPRADARWACQESRDLIPHHWKAA